MVVGILVFCLSFCSTTIVDHDFHLSKCDVIYSRTDRAFQMSLHLFIDDLEAALSAKGHSELGICTPQESSEGEDLMYRYIIDHLQIDIDGKTVIPGWVGKELSDDLAGVWCYLEIFSAEATQSISIRNNLLIEIYADQRNIVKIQHSEDQKAYFLFDNKNFDGMLNITK